VLAECGLEPGAYLIAARPEAALLSFDDVKALVSTAMQALALPPTPPR
jgi:hypothetical protein